MLNFNYTLDSELKVSVGQLPSAIQVQAFEMAANEMTRKFRETQRMLMQPVPGVGASAYAGMSPQWQMRLKVEVAFIAGLLDRLVDVAGQVVFDGAGNALVQGKIFALWNRWSPEALAVYSRTLTAYQKDVSKAIANQPVAGMPAVYIKMAHLAKMDPPVLNPVNNLSGFTSDDAAYLAGLDAEIFGREVPDSAVALGIAALAGAWWWFGPREQAGLSGLGGARRCTKYRTYGGKRKCVSYLPQGPRSGKKIRCARYRTYDGKRHCVARKYM